MGQRDKVLSDTLHLTLGYAPPPVVKPNATVQHNKAVLHASVIEIVTKNALLFSGPMIPATQRLQDFEP